MLIKKMISCFKFILITFLSISIFTNSYAQNHTFDLWLNNFKKVAKKEGISDKTISEILLKSRFLPDVIKYDRYQPEFYEDTKTYINKRANRSKVKKGLSLYNKEKLFINEIETNFGKYLGKMDIVSSLATLSFDKRRSEFFSRELLVLLKLVDLKLVDKNILYGSWAGAFGNFQFMPSTIKMYAIDYDNNSSIELKKIKDSFASAANYINKIGWQSNQPCFYQIELEDNIPAKYLNTSAKKLKNKENFSFFKKYIKNSESLNIDNNLVSAIITPDKDIIPGSKNLKPAFIVFQNYELILKWNRSLRFALAVCTLKEKLENEI